MEERLQKILARAGLASRRGAEELISAGRVAVNGTVVTELGTKVDPEKDRISLDGREIGRSVELLHIVLYKPAGYMATLKDPQGRPLVTDLLKGVRERVYPVGRLDYNTEGLLLLTNDGEWAHTLAHPRHEIDKEYHVRVRGTVSPEQVSNLAAGVDLEEGRTAPAEVAVIKESDNNTWLSVTIHEGRYRQVRRMCEAVGLSVVRLKRVRYGFLGLEGLRQGEYRLLTRDEADRLRLLGRGVTGAEPKPRYREGKKGETPGQRQKGKDFPVNLSTGKRAGASQGKKVKDGAGRGK